MPLEIPKLDPGFRPLADLAEQRAPAQDFALRASAAVWLTCVSCGLFATVTYATPARSAEPAWKPAKYVEVVVGVPPGGPLDKTARLLQKIWQEKKLVEVPTWKEQGADAVFANWRGVVWPKGMMNGDTLAQALRLVRRASCPSTDE